MARRTTQAEKRRNAILGWWGAIALLALWAWQDDQVQLWVLPLLCWAYYELCAVPTLCGVETSRGHPCKNPARGRLMACTAQPSHSVYKTDALLRLIGFRRPPRQPTAPAHGPAGGDGIPAFDPRSPSPPATVQPKQILMIGLTVVATLGGVIQTILFVMR